MKFKRINTFVSEKAYLGNNVRIGNNTTIYDNVIIGDNVVISDFCSIGEPLSQFYNEPESYTNPITTISDNSLIRSFAIIYAGCFIGKSFSTGHRVTIRENTIIGDNCRVGTLSDIQGNCNIGNYCWLHSNVHIGQGSQINNFVFLYPYVILTNDPTPPSNTCSGVYIDDYAQIAVSSILLPGIRVGKHSLVGAGSVVGKDVEDFMLVVGNPAKPIKKVTEIISRESSESHYPWPYRFERGMPWEGIGYEKWLSQ
jgi:acetyltransferase-like isoleucine patch superfamily enzyme